MAAYKMNGKWLVLVLFVATLTPLVAAWGLIQLNWHPSSITANGQILSPPIQLKDVLEPEQSILNDNRWRLLIVEKDCTLACIERLESYRKMHVALGRESDNFSRWLITDSPLKSQDTFLGTATLEQPPVTGMIELENAVWLVDPQGWVMMRFDANQPAAELHKDILRLLKSSNQSA